MSQPTLGSVAHIVAANPFHNPRAEADRDAEERRQGRLGVGSQGAARRVVGAVDVGEVPLVVDPEVEERPVDDLASGLGAGGDAMSFGRKEPARVLVAEVDAPLARAKARAGAASAGPPKVLFVFEAAGGFVYTTGGGDDTSELLGAVGAINVAVGGPSPARRVQTPVT